MSSPDPERFSRLRAVRKVVHPSQSFLDLQRTARLLSDEIETPPNTRALVYDKLVVTIFEQAVEASPEANALLRRVYAKMEPPTITTTRPIRQPSGKMQDTRKRRPNPIPIALKEVEDLYLPSGQPLLVRANKIVVSAKNPGRRIDTELALVIDEGTGASVLEAQQGVLLDAEKQMVAGRKLSKLAVGQAVALELPFMNVPLSGERQCQEIIELLSAELPVTHMEIGPVEWKLSTIACPED